jgi:NAD+ diphosphatase
MGLKHKNIMYFGSQPWPFPNSLMLDLPLTYESGDIQADGNEIMMLTGLVLMNSQAAL